MQHTTTSTLQSHPKPGGGRIASAAYRQSLEFCDDFAGLEENTNRYDLLLLVKRVGKAAGFSPRMIQLIDYYMAFTRDIDWEQGGRPIVYQSLSRTALDMGVSERQIQKLEKQLFDTGAITWNDSGNHKRYGQRDAKTGAIMYAYGVELTPLAYLKEDLENALHEKQLYDQAWMETKRQISWYRRQIRSMLLEHEREEGALAEFDVRYNEIAIQIRTHLDLPTLRTLLDRHKSLHSDLIARVGGGGSKSSGGDQQAASAEQSTIRSPQREQKFVHKKSTTYQSFDKSNTNGRQKSVAKSTERQIRFGGNGGLRDFENPKDVQTGDLILATGLQHISLKHVLQAASDRFREHLPLKPRPMNWADVTEAAHRLRREFYISQHCWGDACGLLGRNGASVCLLLTDRAMQRTNDPVTKPAAYFRSMINRARGGELRLHGSIYGLIETSNESGRP